MCLAMIFYIVSLSFNYKGDASWLAFFVFGCGGIGIGTFESNVLNVMSLVSDGARYFSVLGIPIGVNIITIGSFFFIAVFDGVLEARFVCDIIFALVMICMVAAVFILFKYVPHGPFL